MDVRKVTVREAQFPGELEAFGALCIEYAGSLPYSLCFQGFEEEMRTLPGKYARPGGCVLLAYDGAEPVGGIAMRPIEAMAGDPEPACEMKRLYVRPTARGLGAGRLLAERLIDEAARAGYRMMKLDSERGRMGAAIALYLSLGFVEIERYNDDPMEGTVWLGLRLGP